MIKPHVGLLAIVALVALLMCYEASSPLVRAHDYASTAFATIARNHVEFGLGATRGASILTVDRDAPAQSPVYAHHPFGYPLAIAAVFAAVGASDGAARLLPIVCSLATIVFLYLLVQRWFDGKSALLTAVAYGLTPLNLFYGRLVSLEQPVVLWIVVAVWAWYRWLDQRTTSRYALLMTVLAAGMLTEWQAFYLCLLLPAHYFVIARWAPAHAGVRPTVQLAGVALLGPLMFALFVAHLAVADPAQVDELRRVFWYRAGGAQTAETTAAFGGDASYTPWQFAAQLAAYSWRLMLPPFLLAAAGGTCWLVVHFRRGLFSLLAVSLPGLLVAPALCHTLIFHRTLFIHDCLIILYLPGVAVLAGVGLRQLIDAPRWLSARPLFGAALAIWFVTGSVRETMTLHAEPFFHEAYLGNEIKRLTGPEDDVVVVGTRFHPAVEWYAERDVHFLDTSGSIDEIVARAHPSRLIVFPLRALRDDAPNRPRDQAERLVATRAREAVQYAEQHGRELDRTDLWKLYEFPLAHGR